VPEEVSGAAAGACLVWAEAGSNPRGTEEGKRGLTVKDCIRILEEAEWKVLKVPPVSTRTDYDVRRAQSGILTVLL